MVRGYPDYSSTAGVNEQREPQVQLSTAPIWLFDDFESPDSKWYHRNSDSSLMTGTANSKGYGSAYNGTTFLQLKTQSGTWGEIRRWFGPPPANYNIGMSYFFNLEDNSDFQDRDDCVHLFQLYYYTNTALKVIWLGYNPTDGEIRINDNAGSLNQHIGYLPLAESAWHYVKVIINFATGMWEKLIIDDIEYDLSAYSIYSQASSTAKKFYLEIIAYGASGIQAKMGIDQFRITYNES